MEKIRIRKDVYDFLAEELAKVVSKYKKDENVDAINLITFKTSDNNMIFDVEIINSDNKNINDIIKIRNREEVPATKFKEKSYRNVEYKIYINSKDKELYKKDKDHIINLINGSILYDKEKEFIILKNDYMMEYLEKQINPIYANLVKIEPKIIVK